MDSGPARFSKQWTNRYGIDSNAGRAASYYPYQRDKFTGDKDSGYVKQSKKFGPLPVARESHAHAWLSARHERYQLDMVRVVSIRDWAAYYQVSEKIAQWVSWTKTYAPRICTFKELGALAQGGKGTPKYDERQVAPNEIATMAAAAKACWAPLVSLQSHTLYRVKGGSRRIMRSNPDGILTLGGRGALVQWDPTALLVELHRHMPVHYSFTAARGIVYTAGSLHITLTPVEEGLKHDATFIGHIEGPIPYDVGPAGVAQMTAAIKKGSPALYAECLKLNQDGRSGAPYGLHTIALASAFSGILSLRASQGQGFTNEEPGLHYDTKTHNVPATLEQICTDRASAKKHKAALNAVRTMWDDQLAWADPDARATFAAAPDKIEGLVQGYDYTNTLATATAGALPFIHGTAYPLFLAGDLDKAAEAGAQLAYESSQSADAEGHDLYLRAAGLLKAGKVLARTAKYVDRDDCGTWYERFKGADPLGHTMLLKVAAISHKSVGGNFQKNRWVKYLQEVVSSTRYAGGAAVSRQAADAGYQYPRLTSEGDIVIHTVVAERQIPASGRPERPALSVGPVPCGRLPEAGKTRVSATPAAAAERVTGVLMARAGTATRSDRNANAARKNAGGAPATTCELSRTRTSTTPQSDGATADAAGLTEPAPRCRPITGASHDVPSGPRRATTREPQADVETTAATDKPSVICGKKPAAGGAVELTRSGARDAAGQKSTVLPAAGCGGAGLIELAAHRLLAQQPDAETNVIDLCTGRLSRHVNGVHKHDGSAAGATQGESTRRQVCAAVTAAHSDGAQKAAPGNSPQRAVTPRHFLSQGAGSADEGEALCDRQVGVGAARTTTAEQLDASGPCWRTNPGVLESAQAERACGSSSAGPDRESAQAAAADASRACGPEGPPPVGPSAGAQRATVQSLPVSVSRITLGRAADKCGIDLGGVAANPTARSGSRSGREPHTERPSTTCGRQAQGQKPYRITVALPPRDGFRASQKATHSGDTARAAAERRSGIRRCHSARCTLNAVSYAATAEAPRWVSHQLNVRVTIPCRTQRHGPEAVGVEDREVRGQASGGRALQQDFPSGLTTPCRRNRTPITHNTLSLAAAETVATRELTYVAPAGRPGQVGRGAGVRKHRQVPSYETSRCWAGLQLVGTLTASATAGCTLAAGARGHARSERTVTSGVGGSIRPRPTIRRTESGVG